MVPISLPPFDARGAEATERLGMVLPGGYELRSVIGSGRTGSVYLARQHSLDRRVAVKMMHPGLSGRPDAARRFLAEARAASQLRHPGSVAVFDFGQSEAGEMFLVMEYVDGPTLSELIRDEELSPLAAIDLVLEILGALGEAHEAGVLHLDLDPDNVLVPRDRQGVRHAKVAPGSIDSKYLRGGHQADVDAVSRVLHDLLTRRKPVPGAAADLLARTTTSLPRTACAFAEELLGLREALDRAPPSPRDEIPREAERSPLVGREPELAMALDYALTRRPQGQFVAVRGVLGSGRTRLLDELVGAAQAAGRFVVRVGPDPIGVEISGGALRDMTRQLVAPWTPEPRLAGRAARDRQPCNGERRAALLVDATARLILAVASASNGLLIAVDDLGDIDSLSRKILLAVAERGLPSDTAIVVSAGASHAKELACERTVDLEPLSGKALQRLHGGFAIDAEAVPLAALLYGPVDAGSTDGPVSAWHAIARALDRLPEPARRLLEATCVAGPDSFIQELSSAVVALEQSGLATGTRPSHPLVRAVVRDALSPERRRELASAALRRAISSGERPEVLAHHAVAAGDTFTALVHLDRMATWRARRGDRTGAVAALADAVDVVRAARARSDSQLANAESTLRYFAARLAVARTR